MIIHDGKHWSKMTGKSPVIERVRRETEDFQELQARRTCKFAPAMVRFHVPRTVEEKQHTRCVPETS